ncbi:MAG: hypothetical protein QOJ98_456 [Acidobacteriota bacterium]|jgi:hypothetical protein|nr:hypothetical protein [Acidobacteriota bacterium]
MRWSSALLLTLLALTGCASQPRASGELAVSPAPRSIVAVEVTNTFGRSIDVYYSTQLLGTLAPNAHASYPVAPTAARLPIYARWSGESNRSFNISRGRGVRYVYEDPAPANR